MENRILSAEEKIEEAIEILGNYGQIDGSHHKVWAMDQALRILLGDKYDEWVREYKNGEDGPDTYGYDTGISP